MKPEHRSQARSQENNFGGDTAVGVTFPAPGGVSRWVPTKSNTQRLNQHLALSLHSQLTLILLRRLYMHCLTSIASGQLSSTAEELQLNY